jgi:hypothetical protein
MLFLVLRENLKNVAIYAVFRSIVKQGRRCRSSCGNVETRVLCGFPSSEGIAKTLASERHHFALEASFPTANPRYFKRLAKSGRRSAPNVHLSKLRQMRISPDSRSAPFFCRRS